MYGKTFDAYNGQLQTSALGATRKAAGLTSDIGFHRTMDGELSESLDAFSERVLRMTNRLLGLVSKGKGRLESEEDVVDNFHSLVVDCVDQMLEKTDSCLDEFLGKNKAPAIAINVKAPTSGPVVQHAAQLAKPQLLFKKKADNSDAPWYPSLSHKYHAKVPLGHIYVEDGDGILPNHPYRYEITHLTYPPRMFLPCTPVPPPALEATSPTWVATKPAFHAMLAKLLRAPELAVDLEHHSYRSYAGFLCLMQISDREEDWVVDLLVPEVREEIESLNEVFADPAIVKVFHGAESDIVWLQQDFNLYIVNLFDTFHASKLLEFPRHGLANLLDMYCDYLPDKRFQLADWRVRPLPSDMLAYARSDTHFLLFIYDNLRNALLDRSLSQSQSRSGSGSASPPTPNATAHPARKLLDEALSRSAETSLRVYTKEPYDASDGTGAGGWDTLARRWNKIALSSGGPSTPTGAAREVHTQREIYKAVHGWREQVAREEDESTRYVLQTHLLFLIAEHPPSTIPALLALFKKPSSSSSPSSSSAISPVVKKRAGELVRCIVDAVAAQEMQVGEEEKPTGPALLLSEQKKAEEAERETRRALDEQLRTLPAPLPASASGPGANSRVGSGDAVANTKDGDIWGARVGVPLASESFLFGSSIPVPVDISGSGAGDGGDTNTTKNGFAASTSALFGTTINTSTSTHASTNATKKARHPDFGALVARINRGFALAAGGSGGGMEVTIPSSNTPGEGEGEDAAAEPKAEIDGTTGMQVDADMDMESTHAFVAASQRAPKIKKEEKEAERDTIVVVGQARQKRKRKAAANNAADGSVSGEQTALPSMEADTNPQTGPKAEDVQAPFDFSAAPNILDDNPDLEDRKRKRQRGANKKGGAFYGDFPAPPKAHSELKSGNQSRTFK